MLLLSSGHANCYRPGSIRVDGFCEAVRKISSGPWLLRQVNPGRWGRQKPQQPPLKVHNPFDSAGGKDANIISWFPGCPHKGLWIWQGPAVVTKMYRIDVGTSERGPPLPAVARSLLLPDFRAPM